MKAPLVFAAVALAAIALAQSPQTTGSPAGLDSSTRLADKAIMQAMAAMRMGKKVTITVDNRSIPYAPTMMAKMLYVPVRFFMETGQKVVWDKGDMQATITDPNGVAKNSVEYDASSPKKGRKPGPTMRAMLKGGTLYVPLSSALASFGLVAEWVPTSNRINVKSNRPGSGT